MSDKIHYNDLAPLDRNTTYRMTKEISICLKLFFVYMIYMFMVPILTFTAPALMKTRVWGGMSLTWFMTAIGAMVMAFAIAAIHVYFYTKDFYITEEATEQTSKGAGI